MCLCVRENGSKRQTGVSKANSVSSHIWLKTKLRIDSEILSWRENRDGSLFSPTPIKRNLKHVKSLTNHFQQTMNNPKSSNKYLHRNITSNKSI